MAQGGDFLAFPPLSMKLHSELFESTLEFSIQRHQLSILINLDFVWVMHGFWAQIHCVRDGAHSSAAGVGEHWDRPYA